MPGMIKKNESKNLGERLVQFRKARGLTQHQLAAKIGVTRRAIVYYELEADTLPANILVPMAKALNVSIEEILGITQVKEKPDPQLASLWRKLKVLETFTEKDRKAVLHYIDALAEKNKARPKRVA